MTTLHKHISSHAQLFGIETFEQKIKEQNTQYAKSSTSCFIEMYNVK